MEIFEPYQVEIKTGRTKDELKRRLTERAKIKGDTFFIDSAPYGLISLSIVAGDIFDTADWTIVSFKIYASTFFKGFSYLWLGGVGIALLTFVAKSLINWKYNSEIHLTIVFWIVGFFITQLTFRTSADMQEQSIRQLIKNKE
jgi:hypothetical protein